jgi:hypothetical protein
MRLSSLVLLPCLAAAGCAAHSGNAETVCTSHFGKSCTHYEVRETAEGKFFRETQDRWNQERAARDGTAYFPTQSPGESTFHYLGRMQDANSSSNGKSGPGGSSGSSRGSSSSSSPFGSSSSGGSSFGGSSSSGSGSWR